MEHVAVLLRRRAIAERSAVPLDQVADDAIHGGSSILQVVAVDFRDDEHVSFLVRNRKSLRLDDVVDALVAELFLGGCWSDETEGERDRQSESGLDHDDLPRLKRGTVSTVRGG